MHISNYFTVLLCLLGFLAFAQSPPELINPIPYDSNPTSAGNQSGVLNVADIAAAYNNGRRNEEIQFSLATNDLGNLMMPSQAVWDGMSSDEKVLFLVNEERMARAGVDYNNGMGPVKGYPLTGIEANLDAIAQSAAENFSISGISSAVDSDPVIGGVGCTISLPAAVDCCHELLSPAQPTTASNSYPASAKGYSTSSPPGVVAAYVEAFGVYQHLYEFSSRLFLLIQDEDLNPMTSSAYGFDDNYGLTGEEGFMGVGISIGIPQGQTTHKTYMVILLMDPAIDTQGCDYVCTTCDNDCGSALFENSNPIPNGLYQTSNLIETAGTVPSGGDVTMKAANYVSMNPLFEVVSGGVYHAYTSECFFYLD